MESLPHYQSLQTILESGPLTADAALPIMKQLSKILAEKHKLGQSCLQLCPANILLGPEADIQLSCASQASAYYAPEQHNGGETGPHSDIYSCGIVLFEMVTGALPEGGERPCDRNSDLAPWVNALFDHCYAPRSRRIRDGLELERWLSDRGSSFRAGMEVGTAVEEGRLEPVKVMLPGGFAEPVDSPAPSRRKTKIFAGALTAVCVGMGVAFFMVHQSPRVPPKEVCKPQRLSPWDMYQMALSYYERGQYVNAKDLLDAALKQHTSFAERYRHPAKGYGPSPDEKKNRWHAYLIGETRFAEAYQLRANVLTELGSMEQALLDFDHAVSLNPGNPQVYLDRGNTLVYLKKVDRAALDFKTYLRLSPEAQNSAQVRGWIHELNQSGKL
jgi:tetratricopeptide (TPR) repeat protein